MSSAFTTADRRKKVFTYSKSSRLPSIPSIATPAPAPAPAPNNDAPSPEQPRKHTASSNGTLKKTGAALKAPGALKNGRAATRSPDIFDVPSEDEFGTHTAKPAKKLTTKRRIPEAGRNIPPTLDGAPKTTRQFSKSVQPLGKPKPVAPIAKSTQKPMKTPKAAPVPTPSCDDPIVPSTQQEQFPEPIQILKQDKRTVQVAQRPTVKTKAVPRATTPAPPVPKTGKIAKAKSTLPSRKTVEQDSAKQVEDIGIFDVPSSGDEAHGSALKPPRRAPILSRNRLEKSINSPLKTTQCDSAESDDSNASKKRKRNESVSSTAAIKSADEQKQWQSLPQRSRKYQKKEDSASPGHALSQPPATIASGAPPTLTAINKPRRTRLRTVPVLTRPPITKGQSSPATLNSMLPGRHVSKPSPIAEIPEVTALEDGTMYEIPDSLATPVRPSQNAALGSVTPRQKALFGGLLGTSPSLITPMPSMSKLQLTDKKPISLLGALSRSKSDLTHSTQSRKIRLIDTLKHAESSSEEEASETESGSEEDANNQKDKRNTAMGPANKSRKYLPSSDIMSDGMDVDVEVAADSQTSQANSGFGVRPKLTYAKSRSYLQEANPEDALLMSMDLDDNVGLGSQKKDNIEEDEDEASQVRANHELRRQGKNTSFQLENEMLIDDIAETSTSSIRRSTMLEFCAKMADETFVHQLLDSSLTHQFLENIASSGEVIFDFAAAVAVVFILRTNPTYTMLNQIHQSGVMTSLIKLLDEVRDIQRVAKDRATNLSKIAQDSVTAFRTVAIGCDIWSPWKPSLMSPQLVALKALDLQVLAFRRAGIVEMAIDQDTIVKLVDIASMACERLKSGKDATHDRLLLELVFSTLEGVSLAKQKQPIWSARTLQRLAEVMPASFQADDGATIALAVKLCMNLTNNKPKACQQFSDPVFVQSLVRAIIHRFELLHAGLGEEQRTEVLETLILSLGAMINLTEHSDQARMNVDDGKELVETLVNIFLEGSARAAQADSMEESQSSVVVGYLSVLLGNVCLNKSIRSNIRARLPDQRLAAIIDKIKEFVDVHEHVDRKAKHFKGEEGQETWHNYTARLMHVVEMLEQAQG